MLNIFDTRLLIATINDPELMNEQQPTRTSLFFGGGPLSSYATPPEATESDTVDILKRSGMNGLAEFNASGGEANVVHHEADEVLQTVNFPIISEKTPLEAKDLVRLQSLTQKIYRTNPESIEQIQNRILNQYMRNLRIRAENREEWMIFQTLTTGVITYSGSRIKFKIDLGISSTYLPVLSGTARWGQADANINGNLSDWTDSINDATGGYGGNVILGTNAAKLLLADESVRKTLDNNNLSVGRMNMDLTSMDLGMYGGFRFMKWNRKYKDANGNKLPLFPANGVLMIGNTFRLRRLFGLNEDFVDGQRPGDPFFSKSWEQDDPAVRWVNAKSRPLPLPEQEGSWVFATVA